jgi:hypothetical protein
MKDESPVRRLAVYAVIALVFLLGTAAWGGLYTAGRLRAARLDGLFPSPEEGMLSLVSQGYATPWEAEIVYAGPNSFDGSSPHVWYVIACVWAAKRFDGSTVGNQTRDYDAPGSFFLQTEDGWVHIPEGWFPEFIGFWMRVYGTAGPGSHHPTREWGSAAHSGCNHQAG